jgi:NTE family protein
MDGATMFFSGMTEAEIAEAADGLERRTFPAGTVLMAEGDVPGEMYVLREGSAAVLVDDHTGVKRIVGRIRPGETIGEMSLLTREPASATVRLDRDSELLVIGENDLAELSWRRPELERNILRILAARLARANKVAAGRQLGRLTVLDDRGAPPLLGYALSASMAWHTRAPTLHMTLSDAPAPDLEQLARHAGSSSDGRRQHGAELVVSRPEGELAPDRIEATLLRLTESYDDVVVHVMSPEAASLAGASTVRLAASEAPAGGYAVEIAPDAAVPFLNGHHLRTPPLVVADERALEQGMLPAVTGAGQSLGRLARRLVGLEVGVALGTGSARGYAHLGVLRGLERAGIPVDYLAGTSIGAVVAALYSEVGDVDRVTKLLDELGARMFRPTFPRRSLLSTRSMRRHMRKAVGDRPLEDLPIPVAVVATDVETHDEVVLSRGSATTAVFASSAIPGVFPAVRIGSRTLVDGGIVNPVPASVAAGLGAGVVIAVRLVSGGGIGEEISEEGKGPIPNVVAAIVRSIETVQTRIKAETGLVPVVAITPDLGPVQSGRLRKFREGGRFVPDGEAAVEEALPRLSAVLPWLRD